MQLNTECLITNFPLASHNAGELFSSIHDMLEYKSQSPWHTFLNRLKLSNLRFKKSEFKSCHRKFYNSTFLNYRDDYKQIFELLAFNRQYELYIRKLLSDVESMAQSGSQCVDNIKMALEELHSAVKYKAAVPVVTVFVSFFFCFMLFSCFSFMLFPS